MKDLIDERNFREKCARSIIKGYNVNYITKEEAEAQKAVLEEKQEEIAAAPVTTENLEDESRWAHIPSAGYGKVKDNDPVTEEQIQKILRERQNNLNGIIEEAL